MSGFGTGKWRLEEDYVIQCICDTCGNYHGEEVDFCEDCGESETLSIETAHEDVECDICGRSFGVWEDWFVNEENKHICKHCYNELA